jgi:prepilin-type N-terminal cleavage/methylation domain-containing protein
MSNSFNIIKQGFSLVELIVVIAIVAILAAIAVSSYQTYMLKTQLASLAPYIGKNIEQSIEYYQKNGTFPDAYQLGIPNTDPINYYYGPGNPVIAGEPLLDSLWIIGNAHGSNDSEQIYFLQGSGFYGNIISKTNNTRQIGSADRIVCTITVQGDAFLPSCHTYLEIDNFAGPAGNYDLFHVP